RSRRPDRALVDVVLGTPGPIALPPARAAGTGNAPRAPLPQHRGPRERRVQAVPDARRLLGVRRVPGPFGEGPRGDRAALPAAAGRRPASARSRSGSGPGSGPEAPGGRGPARALSRAGAALQG